MPSNKLAPPSCFRGLFKGRVFSVKHFAVTSFIIAITTSRYIAAPSFPRHLSNSDNVDENDVTATHDYAQHLMPVSESVHSGHCITPEMIGEWKNLDRSLPENQFSAPHCCPMDGDDLRLTLDDHNHVCEQDEIIKAGGHSCRCTPGTQRSEALDFSLSWESPYVPKFDPAKVCSMLGQRKIALIGDSTANQASSVLTDAFYPGGCSGNVNWLISDTLVDRAMGNMNRGDHWVKQIHENDFPNIIILSLGAHVHTEEQYTHAIDEVMEDIQRLQKEHPEVQVVWKTQSPAGCTEHVAQSHPLDAGLEFKFDKYPNNQYPYWSNLFARDQSTIWKMIQIGVPILDVRMLYARSDAHVTPSGDCLHFCLPGPLDVIPALVQKLLENDFQNTTCVNSNEDNFPLKSDSSIL